MTEIARRIRQCLMNAGMTPAGAAGMMGNIQAESEMIPNRVEVLCLQRLREVGKYYTDATYTAFVDDGTISREQFLHPLPGRQYGYGLVQLTSPSRKAGLYDLCKKKKVSIGDLETQLEYLITELRTSYPGVFRVLSTTNSIDEASDTVLLDFEQPGDCGASVKETRRRYSREFYVPDEDDEEVTGMTEAQGNKEKGTGMTEAQAIDKVLSIALAEEGYHEKASPKNLNSKTANSGSANYTKYGKQMHALQPSNMDYPAAWCFTAGTMVLTDNGYKPIEELKVGDKVLNAYGNTFNTVTKVLTHDEEVYEMRSYGSLRLRSTGDHPFLSNQRLGVRKDWKHTPLDFYPLKNLRHGDNVITPVTKVANNLDLTYDEAWVVGYFVGDGWKTCRGVYRLCGSDKKERELYKHISSIRKDADYPSRTCNEYTIDPEPNMRIIPILDEAGTGAANKTVPVSIMFAPLSVKEAFLDGYMTADGTKEGHFSTVSKALALGIAKIIFDLGYGCALRECIRSERQVIYDKRIEDYRLIKVRPVIYCGKINTSEDAAHRMDRRNGDLIYLPIKNNCETGDVETVYNITTDGDHTFLANNLSVHNCDCFVDWCFKQAFGADLARKMLCGTFDDYTVNSANMFKNANRWTQKAKKGYQIFFRNNSGICHTGLVYKVAGEKLYTIEGNSSDAVRRREYYAGEWKIAGYGMPKYFLAVGSDVPSDAPSADPDRVTASQPAQSFNRKIAGPYKTTADLNMRDGAGTNFKILTTLPKGTVVQNYGYYTSLDGVKWLYVQVGIGRVIYTGFCSEKYLNKC